MNETGREEDGFEAGRRSEGPGQTLSAARRKRGLELAAAAEAIGVPQEVLAALEADEWDRLDAPVYVRGYLRKYARLLELDEESVLAAYEANAAPRDPAIHAHFTQGLGVHRDVRWLIPVTGVIVVVVLILVGLWSWHRLRTKAHPAQAPAAAASAMMAHESSSVAGAGASAAATNGTALTGAAAATTASRGAPSSGGIHLVLQMMNPSWVEVYGTGHKRLYYNLAAAGTRLHFDQAQGPIDVFLGNASGVKIEVNGQPFQVPAKDVTGNTARFELHLKQPPGPGTAP